MIALQNKQETQKLEIFKIQLEEDTNWAIKEKKIHLNEKNNLCSKKNDPKHMVRIFKIIIITKVPLYGKYKAQSLNKYKILKITKLSYRGMAL